MVEVVNVGRVSVFVVVVVVVVVAVVIVVVFIVFDNAKAHQRQRNSEGTRSRAGFLRSSESRFRQPELTSVSGTADKHTLGRPEDLTHATEWALAATTTTNIFFLQTWVSGCFLQHNKECEGRHQAKLYQRYYSCSVVSLVLRLVPAPTCTCPGPVILSQVNAFCAMVWAGR